MKKGQKIFFIEFDFAMEFFNEAFRSPNHKTCFSFISMILTHPQDFKLEYLNFSCTFLAQNVPVCIFSLQTIFWHQKNCTADSDIVNYWFPLRDNTYYLLILYIWQ